MDLWIYRSIYLSTYLSIYLSNYLSIQLSIYLSIYRSIDRSICLSIYLSIQLSIYLSIYLSICLSIHLSIYPSSHPSIHLSIYPSVYLQAWKWSYSARLPPFLKVTTWKTKQFCEASSTFELEHVKNEASLRDVLNFGSWQHQKRSNSARLPSIMESWMQRADGLVPMRFAIFPLHLSKVLRLPRKSDARSYEVRSAAPVTQNHLSKPEDLMLQHATPLRKSAAWPTNISDENLSCNAPATRNPFLQILFKCPTPAIVFGHATKTVTFCSLFARCRIPCTCHTKRRFNVQKWREHGVLCTFWIGIVLRATTACTFSSSQLPKVLENDVLCAFWLGNVLHATRACTFSTSQLPKVLRTCQFLTLLTSKCASCHNCVYCFDITTSKSTPRMMCFVHFDLETCFAPQRRALFHHLNFQTCSENGVLCTFWLGNVLRATMVCNFSTSQLPKVLWEWCALCILTWKCASRHICVHFFISHLTTWLRTRCFSEPTFRSSGAPNHWKNTMFRDFPTFSRTCIFFLLTLSLLLSSLFCSSPLWLFPPLLFHLSILSEVWLLNFLQLDVISLYGRNILQLRILETQSWFLSVCHQVADQTAQRTWMERPLNSESSQHHAEPVKIL